MKSMTGFGRFVARQGKAAVLVEVKTVNHRHLSLNFRFPPIFSSWESRAREIIRLFLQRGAVEVFVKEVSAGVGQKPTVRFELLRSYLQVWKDCAKKMGFPGPPPVDRLFLLPEITAFEEDAAYARQRSACFEKALRGAMKILVRSREKEGKFLKKEFYRLTREFQNILLKLKHNYRKTLEKKIEQFRKKVRDILSRELQDGPRLATEEALLLQRWDVQEELTRLSAHLEAWETLLQSSGPVGRKMDFWIQEMNREVNTLGSKIADVEWTKAIVRMKEILECFREQAQNVE